MVYSFGIGYNWDFEKFMAKIGCKVHVFDPIVQIPEDIKKINHITVDNIGIGKVKTKQKFKNSNKAVVEVPIVTLQQAMEMYKEENHDITYLKMDIEGMQFTPNN